MSGTQVGTDAGFLPIYHATWCYDFLHAMKSLIPNYTEMHIIPQPEGTTGRIPPRLQPLSFCGSRRKRSLALCGQRCQQIRPFTASHLFTAENVYSICSPHSRAQTQAVNLSQDRRDIPHANPDSLQIVLVSAFLHISPHHPVNPEGDNGIVTFRVIKSIYINIECHISCICCVRF